MQAFPLHRFVLQPMVFASLALTVCCLHAQTATRITTSSDKPELLPKAGTSSTVAKKSPTVIGRPTIDRQMMSELPMSCVQSWEHLDLPESDRPVVDQTGNLNPQLSAILGAASGANESSATVQQNPFFLPTSPSRLGVQPVSRRMQLDGSSNGNDLPADDDDLLAGDDEELLPAPKKIGTDASSLTAPGTEPKGVQTASPRRSAKDQAVQTMTTLYQGWGLLSAELRVSRLNRCRPILQMHQQVARPIHWSSCIRRLRPVRSAIQNNMTSGGLALMPIPMCHPRFIALNKRCRT